MNEGLDPRLNVARKDLAASRLRGLVEAARFVEGEAFTVAVDVLDMKRLPRRDAPLDTQLLYGEGVRVYEDEEGWGWAQADRDDYVGYVAMSGLRAGAPPAATHRVSVERTFVYPAPDMKRPVIGTLPLDGRVRVEGHAGTFLRIEGSGFVVAGHLAPLETPAQDFVAVAESLIGTPYLWGGKSPLGIDCSGLVQLSCSAAGLAMPRDTHMQETVGVAIEPRAVPTRGDLVFWPGHVGIMRNDHTLLHANAHHMLVSAEPLDFASHRIAATGAMVRSIRRVKSS